jgi:hypothetical protein
VKRAAQFNKAQAGSIKLGRGVSDAARLKKIL